MYPVGNFNLYALLGYGEVEITNIPLGDVDRAEDGFQWGLGAGYQVNNEISVFIDYTQMYNDTGFDYRAVNSDILADAWTLGLSYKF
jgi:opacity protein-like surface antigen